MPDTRNRTDVLIAGAGPVGLFLANECARRELRFRIIEARPAQSIYSKALAIFPRTLEIFDMAGVVAPFLEQANRVTKVAVISHERPLAHMRFEPQDTPYPFVAMVPQNVTEALLVEELRRKGGNVEYNTAFVSAEQHDDAVTATIERDGRQSQVEASFLAGCDGPHSKVRESLNLPFEGGDYDDSFMLADIESNQSLPADEMQICPSELGPLAIFPISATRRRIVAMVDNREGDAPSLDQVRALVAERAPAGLEVRALHWTSYFRIHHRCASKLRSGRIFIAGDAAHIHSPFGGQGMNTGLHDIWNLAWKFDFFLRGNGNQQLLASYEAERLPVIKSVIETTDLMTKALGTRSKIAQVLRDAIIPMTSHLAPFQHAFVNRLSEPRHRLSRKPHRRRPGQALLRRFPARRRGHRQPIPGHGRRCRRTRPTNRKPHTRRFQRHRRTASLARGRHQTDSPRRLHRLRHPRRRNHRGVPSDALHPGAPDKMKPCARRYSNASACTAQLTELTSASSDSLITICSNAASWRPIPRMRAVTRIFAVPSISSLRNDVSVSEL